MKNANSIQIQLFKSTAARRTAENLWPPGAYLMLVLGDFLLLISHWTFTEVFLVQNVVKSSWYFYNEQTHTLSLPVLVNGNQYELMSPAPVGAATKADGQEEDEKKMDEGKKEPDRQSKMVFI